jgi:pSer/pThr/pTyr-binding forkhead associated (FHA) protein
MWQVIVKDAAGQVRASVPLNQGALTLGRGRDCAIVLDSKLVSRLHARLTLEAGRVTFKDEGSGNGSLVDGLPARIPIPVNETTRIEIAEFRIELQRQAVAAEKKAEAAPTVQPAKPMEEIAGFRILDAPEKPAAASKPATAASTLSDSMANLLDRQMAGIQSQRSANVQGQQSERERFEQEWKDAIAAASELRKRVGEHPKVRYFVVSRDGREVSAKISDSSRLGYCNMILSRRHPEKDTEIDGRVWYAESGMTPESFSEPKEALAALVKRIAAKLA